MKPPHLYRGGVTYVVDGRHYDVVIDVGFFMTIRVPVELKGLDIPPKKSGSSEDRVLAQGAKDAAMDILLNRWVLVETHKEAHHPKIWPAKIYLDATSEIPGVMKEVEGEMMVDFSSYMNALKREGFHSRAIELTYAERTKRSRKTFQKGS